MIFVIIILTASVLYQLYLSYLFLAMYKETKQFVVNYNPSVLQEIITTSQMELGLRFPQTTVVDWNNDFWTSLSDTKMTLEVIRLCGYNIKKTIQRWLVIDASLVLLLFYLGNQSSNYIPQW